MLDHFVEAASGRPDRIFFGSCVNLMGASGMPGPPITGWISVFFPYLKQGLVENRAIDSWRKAYDAAKAQPGVQGITAQLSEGAPRGGVDLSNIPTGLATAPVKLVDVRTNKIIEVKVLGGLATMHQAPDGALEVRSGWAVQPAAQPAEFKSHRKRRIRN